MWLKIWRDTSSHAGRPDYAEYETEDQIEDLLEYFDEKITNWDGYHNLQWEKIDKPPKEWVVKKLTKYKESLKTLKIC